MAEKLSGKEIDDLVVSLIGEEILPLVAQLKNKMNVSEFKLAENLNITVNQVRNMLYKMHQHNLVTFIRKKDKKKGWYIYYWTINEAFMREALINFMKRKMDDFRQKLEKEMEGNYFICPNKCTRVSLEQAMAQEFHCLECGELMQQQDNSRTIDNLKSRINELEEEIKLHTPKPVVAKPVAAKKLAKPKTALVTQKKILPTKKAVQKTAGKKPVQKVVKILPVKKPVARIAQKKPAVKAPQMPQSKASKLLNKRPLVMNKALSFAKKFLKKKR